MIFVTVGSQRFQFDRLLKKVDQLVGDGVITEEVYAQTGASGYLPQNYPAKSFCDRAEFAELLAKCRLVITHGGTGTIISAVKQGKKVIAVPRLARYQEHVDDHQLQLLRQFEETGMICVCADENELPKALEAADTRRYASYCSNTEAFIASLEDYIHTIGKPPTESQEEKAL